jgi:hypothetical protein
MTMHLEIQKTMGLLPHLIFLNCEITFVNSHSSSSVFQQLKAYPTSLNYHSIFGNFGILMPIFFKISFWQKNVIKKSTFNHLQYIGIYNHLH